MSYTFRLHQPKHSMNGPFWEDSNIARINSFGVDISADHAN